MATATPDCSLSWPTATTRSPAFNPLAISARPSVRVPVRTKVRTAVEGLGALVDDYEFHFPQELSPANLADVREALDGQEGQRAPRRLWRVRPLFRRRG